MKLASWNHNWSPRGTPLNLVMAWTGKSLRLWICHEFATLFSESIIVKKRIAVRRVQLDCQGQFFVGEGFDPSKVNLFMAIAAKSSNSLPAWKAFSIPCVVTVPLGSRFCNSVLKSGWLLNRSPNAFKNASLIVFSYWIKLNACFNEILLDSLDSNFTCFPPPGFSVSVTGFGELFFIYILIH